MPKFDASSIGGALEFDFSKWNGPKGEVPEPPRAAVNKVMKAISNSFKELGFRDSVSEDENMTMTEVAETMEKVDDEEMFERLNEALIDHLADLCGGTPSRDELAALPYRPFMGFFGYLIGNLTNPEASAPGSTNSQRRLRSV